MGIRIDGRTIIFERTFDAPIERVFAAYSQSELFEQWFHPDGAVTKVHAFDFKPGGRTFFSIETPDFTSYTVMDYISIQTPHSFEYHDYFANAQGEINPDMPSNHIYMTFEEKTPGQTTVCSKSVFETEAMVEEMLRMGIEEGMTRTLDQLDTLLDQLDNGAS